MRNDRDRAVRDALWQLAALPGSTAKPTTEPLPFFLRAPSVAALWAVTLLTVMGLLVLGRVHVPRRVHGAAVAVRTNADSLALLLLLPATAQPHVRVGQQAVLDTGDREPIVLTVTGIEANLLDAETARRRFSAPASLIAQLEAPKIVVRVSRCARNRCLTPSPGATYAATASLGTRTLGSYVMSRS